MINVIRSRHKRRAYDDFDVDVIKRPYKRKKFKKTDWDFTTEDWDKVGVMSPDDLFNFNDVKKKKEIKKC